MCLKRRHSDLYSSSTARSRSARRHTGDYPRRRHHGALRHDRALRDHAPLAHICPVAHHGAHADDGVVAELGHVVDYATVAQRHPRADRAGLAGARVHDAVVLHGAAFAEDDASVVAPQASARPDPAAGAQPHVTDHIGRRVHPAALADVRRVALEAHDSHGVRPIAVASRRDLPGAQARRLVNDCT